MHELWESSKTQSSAIRISKLIKPTIYVGTELLWLEGKTKSKKKRTVVLGMSRNKDTFHATLVDENNKQTYLCVQTEQPITLEKNFNWCIHELSHQIKSRICCWHSGEVFYLFGRLVSV